MTREERRRAMPESSKFIDWIRSEVGNDQVVFIKAQENGHSIEWGERQMPDDEGVIASKISKGKV
jgi:hypothetical protein